MLVDLNTNKNKKYIIEMRTLQKRGNKNKLVIKGNEETQSNRNIEGKKLVFTENRGKKEEIKAKMKEENMYAGQIMKSEN